MDIDKEPPLEMGIYGKPFYEVDGFNEVEFIENIESEIIENINLKPENDGQDF